MVMVSALPPPPPPNSNNESNYLGENSTSSAQQGSNSHDDQRQFPGVVESNGNATQKTEYPLEKQTRFVG